MTEGTLKVVARIVAQADKVEGLQSVLRGLVRPSQQEPGCMRYTLLQNDEDRTDFTIIEEWESVEAFESHLASHHFKEAASKLPDLLALEPDIRKYHSVA